MSADIAPAEPAPKVEPERLALRVRPRPVMRMSRRMIALMIGVSAAALAGAAMWSLSKRAIGPGGATELYNVDRVQTADGLANLPRDYRTTAKSPAGVPQLGGPMPGDLGRPMLRAQEEGRLAPGQPVAPDQAGQSIQTRADEARRQRDAVRRSNVLFQSGQGVPGAFAALAPDVASAGPADPAAPPVTAPVDGSQAAKRAFMATDAQKRIYASGQIQTPQSPYQLMAGTVIAAALVTGISSDLPGDIIATVTANVFDSVTGRYLLIPQGTRLFGRYDSGIGYAQNRLLLKWERMIFPDGSSILLDNLPGADAAGRTGLKDRTDNRFDRLAGGAVLATLLGVGASYGTNRVGGDRSIVIATGDSAQQAVTQVGQDITARNLDVQPTLTIRPGFPLRVIVERDLILRPVKLP
ncbi:TrbI/VirB10 family protein [soil metagenome]